VEIKWSKSALNQLDKALDFIIQEGFAQCAAELQNGILSRIDNLIDSYDIYPLDKYKRIMMAVIMPLKLTNTVYHIGLKLMK
jgi:hypothetical protein